MSPLRLLPYLYLLPGLLASCCANDRCDCDSARADALVLQFETVPDALPDTTHFKASEVDTVYVLRYAVSAAGTTGPSARDSVALVRPLAQVNDPIYLDNAAPFAAVGGRKLDAFRYQVSVRRNDRKYQYFKLDNIVLQGQYVGTGCCTCYRNARKTLLLNGQRFDVTASGGITPPLRLTKQ